MYNIFNFFSSFNLLRYICNSTYYILGFFLIFFYFFFSFFLPKYGDVCIFYAGIKVFESRFGRGSVICAEYYYDESCVLTFARVSFRSIFQIKNCNQNRLKVACSYAKEKRLEQRVFNYDVRYWNLYYKAIFTNAFSMTIYFSRSLPYMFSYMTLTFSFHRHYKVG